MANPPCLLLGLWCLVGCNQPFVTPQESVPVGIGLKAGFGVAIEDCNDAAVHRTCTDDAFALHSARATNEHATFVGIQDTVAMFRGQSVGLATGTIETADNDDFDFEFEVVEIDEQRLEIIGAPFEDIYPVEAPVFLTRATLQLDHITQSYGVAGYLQHLRGQADVVVETTDTQARIGATASLIELFTGAVPGKAILHTSSGLAHAIQIAGPDQIAALDLYDDRGRTTTSLVLGKTFQRIVVVPLLGDHRPIAGCGADQPRATTGSLAVQTTVIEGGSYCAINVLRLDPGDTTVTITWGTATVTLPVADPAPR